MQRIEAIKERLQKSIGKAEIVHLADEVANMDSAIDVAISWLYLPGKIALRASWLVENIIIPKSSLHQRYAIQLCDALLKSENPAMRRNVAKTIAQSYIPEEREDELFDFSIRAIGNSNEAVAVKVHCVSIAFQITLRYPELATEIYELIKEQEPKNSVAFAACSRKYMKNLEKMMA